MGDMNKLSPPALKAAMVGGTVEWGTRASIFEHVGYVEPQIIHRRGGKTKNTRGGSFRNCHCGCRGKAKFRAMFNGICMASGCELSMRRFAKTGR